MKSVPLPDNEEDRLKALAGYNLLDTPAEEAYDDVTRIASEICRTPIAIISLVDSDRQWFKSKQGLNADETPRAHSFCAHAILNPNEIFIVPDARRDDRFSENPLTTGSPNIVFYAGVPLTGADGYALGSLCVIDSRLRTLTDNQLLSLKSLARLVTTHFELRKVRAERDQYQSALKQATLSRKMMLLTMTDQVRPLVDPMLSDIKTLTDGSPRPDQVAYLQSLWKTGDRLKNTLDDLDLAKRG